MTSRPLFIVGAGGLAREMQHLVRQLDSNQERWRVHGFVDSESGGGAIGSPPLPVMGEREFFNGTAEPASLVLAIGWPEVRERVIARFSGGGPRDFDFPVLIHPSTTIDADATELGAGTIVTAGCVLTTDIAVGRFNLVNWTSTIGHDCRIGDFNVINPGCHISGAVTIGNRNLVGSGTVILQGLTIGDDCVIGAGSVVTRDLESGHVYMGSPARPVRKNEARA